MPVIFRRFFWLGVNFKGTKNYLAGMRPDVLPKKILHPSLLDTFWGAANDGQKRLTKNSVRPICASKRAGKTPQRPISDRKKLQLDFTERKGILTA